MNVVHRRPQGPDSDAPPGTAQPISRAPEAAPTVRVQYPPQPIETGRGASPLLRCLRRLLRSRLPRWKALPVGAQRPSQLPDAELHQCSGISSSRCDGCFERRSGAPRAPSSRSSMSAPRELSPCPTSLDRGQGPTIEAQFARRPPPSLSPASIQRAPHLLALPVTYR